MGTPVLALTFALCACGRSHSACVEEDATTGGDPTGLVFETRDMPWPDVQIRFLGLTDLGETQEDVELRWELRTSLDLGVAPVLGQHGPQFDVVGLAVERDRAAGITNVRLHLAHGGRFRPPFRFLMAAHEVGLLLADGDRRFWRTATRGFVTSEGHAGPRREFDRDGTLSIELVGAPRAMSGLGNTWYLVSGAEYALRYRVHNQTDDPLDVEVWVGSAEDRLQVEVSTENRIIEAGTASDLDLRMHVEETLGPCPACLQVAVRPVGAGRYADAVMLEAEVIPP